ncbi:MAG: fatty acid desaturase DesE [Candidatus Promineifilaceae bacterium]
MSLANKPKIQKPAWREAVARYQNPDLRRSWGQVASSLIPYILLWGAMIWSLQISYWLTLVLAVPAAGFLVRIFIICHDCGHGSFFPNRQTNDIMGVITGLLVFVPYFRWRHDHAIHHATAGDLDRRGVGDVWTLTVAEYLEMPPRKQLAYHIYRNPLIMFVIAPLFAFVIGQRFAPKGTNAKGRRSVLLTNLAVLGIAATMSLLIGLKAYLLIQMPVMAVAASVGIWLFYVQHQFEGVYWAEHENWDYFAAALQGSSFYKLPKVLQWFSGNIGFHHIHHLSPRIPNYYLEKCHQENPLFHEVKTITLWSSLKSLSFRLWDTERQQLVGFNFVKQLQQEQSSSQASV